MLAICWRGLVRQAHELELESISTTTNVVGRSAREATIYWSVRYAIGSEHRSGMESLRRYEFQGFCIFHVPSHEALRLDSRPVRYQASAAMAAHIALGKRPAALR